MERIVHYHHPQATDFSLHYSSSDQATVLGRSEQASGDVKLLGYPFEPPLYVCYERSAPSRSVTEGGFDLQSLRAEIGNLDRATAVTCFRLLELLESAVDARDGGDFRLYKEFEPDQVQRALSRVTWGESLPTVAGELASNLVLRHAMPNANHRTAIALAQFCIESVAPNFEMPTTHRDDRTWREWCDPYVVESKRLLTVRRNNLRLRALADHGVDAVERKGGLRIALAAFDLDMHWRDALSVYAERHERHCVRFTEALLERASRPDLLGRTGPTEEQFVEYLEMGVVDREFDDLF